MAHPNSFVLVRHLMRGDVLLCSAVVRALNLKHPEAEIFFRTRFPEVFRNNPRVKRTSPGEIGYGGPPETVINLDLVRYDKTPDRHLIDGFAQCAGFPDGTCPHTLEIYPGESDHRWAREQIPPAQAGKYVVVAPGPGLWLGRAWPESRWRDLIEWLVLEAFLPVVVVGAHEPGCPAPYNLPTLTGVIDLRNKTNFLQLAAIISGARLFIGIDSFPTHVAGAVGTPRVTLFGVTSPELILCDAPNTIAVKSDPSHPFTGIRHRLMSMNQIDLGNPPRNPMDTISVESVRQAISGLLPLAIVGKPPPPLPTSSPAVTVVTPARHYLIGSGYIQNAKTPIPANEFADTWMQNIIHYARPLPDKVIVVTANNAAPFYRSPVDVIVCPGDLGHIKDKQEGRKNFDLVGWTPPMIATAMIAYNAVLDFIFVEQDCLAFGPWVERMYQDLGNGDWVIGRPLVTDKHVPATQALFLVRHAAIWRFVRDYLAFGPDINDWRMETKDRLTGERKFALMRKRAPDKVKELSFGVDRDRPIPWSDPVWYCQQWKRSEFEEAKRRGIVA